VNVSGVTPIKKRTPAKPPLDPAVWTNEPWEDRLVFTADGRPKRTTANLLLIFENHPQWRDCLRYNERWKRVVWSGTCPIDGVVDGAQLTQHDVSQATKWVQDKYEMDTSVKVLGEIMALAAHGNGFDPVRDWMDGLEWDGVPRLDHILSDCIGCDHDAYTAAIGAKFLLSAVSRTYHPGCKVDTMLILIGKQGLGKSRFLRSLVPNERWFLDDLPNIDTKDAKQALHGPLIVEMPELDAMRKAEATATKKFLSIPADDFRAPYAPFNEFHPRRCVFSGSTNQRVPLQDPSGGRRFWPVAAKEIEQSCLEDNRDNYWAEAIARFRAGEEWWLTGDAEIMSLGEQSLRTASDPLESMILEFLAATDRNDLALPPPTHDKKTGLRLYTTSAEIIRGLELPTTAAARSLEMRISDVLLDDENGPWVKGRINVNGIRPWVYLAPKRKGE